MRTFVSWSLVLLLPGSLLAWGPHPQITRAAQAVLPEAEKAAAYFGKDWTRLQDYCLMPDLRGSVREDFYPNDFTCAAGRSEFGVTAPATAGAVQLLVLSEGKPGERAAGVWLTLVEKP